MSANRVIHVSYQDPAHLYGGQGVTVLNFCMTQVAMGFETVWISPCIKDEEPGEFYHLDGKLRVHKIKFSDEMILTLFSHDEAGQRNRERFGDEFVKLIKATYSPESCYIHLHGFIEVPRRAGELRNAGYNCTSTYHMFLSPRIDNTNEDEPFVNRLREIEYESISNNSKVIVNSLSMQREAEQLCPDFQGALHMIPNGIDNIHFDMPRFPSDETPLITTYGRISPEKGFEIVLQAARMITDQRRSAGHLPPNFLVFGKTDETIAARRKYVEQLHDLAADYDNITLDLRPEGIWGEERIRLLDRSTIGIMPSRYEPFGLVVVEYMARGIPVISTLTHGAKDIFETEGAGETPCGIVVDTEPEPMAAAINTLLDDAAKRQSLAANGEAKASRLYKLSHITERVVDLYRS